KIQRPLNSVPQHQRRLTETLSSPNAIWTLASLLLPKAPEPDLRRVFNYQMIHLEAYIVHVDMVLRNEVAYKLTPETIESLIKHHKDIYCVDSKANTHDWPEKEQQCKELHEGFVQAVNKFEFRTHVSALEGLEEVSHASHRNTLGTFPPANVISFRRCWSSRSSWQNTARGPPGNGGVRIVLTAVTPPAGSIDQGPRLSRTIVALSRKSKTVQGALWDVGNPLHT
ncbi:hypothetical protein C8A05DRAFT_20086, partial [Staphylotrichum tortipilum]